MNVSTATQAPTVSRAVAWQTLFVAWLGWLFDGYETYALVLVAGVAMRDLLPADQLRPGRRSTSAGCSRPRSSAGPRAACWLASWRTTSAASER